MRNFNKNIMLPAVAAAALAFTSQTAKASDLMVSFADPVGDSTSSIDATRMVVVFDPATGDFKATFTATNAQPFQEDFRININLFNQSKLPFNSIFNSAGNDYNFANGRTKVIIRGNNANLKFWMPGDVVTTNTDASGGVNPPGIVFYRTSVSSFPLTYLTNEDAIAYGPAGAAPLTRMTAQAAVSGLMDDVQVLYEEGILNREQANGLMAKLSAILKSLNATISRNGQPACGMMNGFINAVQDLAAQGVILQKFANMLINEANKAGAQIGC